MNVKARLLAIKLAEKQKRNNKVFEQLCVNIEFNEQNESLLEASINKTFTNEIEKTIDLAATS